MDAIKELLECCNSTSLLTFVIFLSVFIEIVPIKVNPVSAVFKWIGKVSNKDIEKKIVGISTKLENVSERIDKIENRIDMIEINNMRTQILDFANSCMNGRKHTKEEFEHMIDLHGKYMDIINEKNMVNGRMDLAYKYISDLYVRCLNENSFLDS